MNDCGRLSKICWCTSLFSETKEIKDIQINLSFDEIFQSFIDPKRPTEEEFVMFKLQYGVDWIVEPL